jgi:hypothetical protein
MLAMDVLLQVLVHGSQTGIDLDVAGCHVFTSSSKEDNMGRLRKDGNTLRKRIMSDSESDQSQDLKCSVRLG